MHQDLRNSFNRTVKAAPWFCLGSLLVIAATFAYNKLYVGAVLLAPIMGLLAFSLLLAYWRTGKEWLVVSVGLVFFAVSIGTSSSGLLWGFPQSMAVTGLFLAAPIVLSQKLIGHWLERKHS